MSAMVKMKNAMQQYFRQLMSRWASLGGYPKIPFNELADPKIYVGSPDDNEIISWQPLKRDDQESFEAFDSVAINLHQSVKDYFSCFWFCAIGGYYDQYQIQLEPVLPGIETRALLANILGYMSSHRGTLEYVPIGVERNGLLVVVSNANGQVYLEDYHSNVFFPLADSLSILISKIVV